MNIELMIGMSVGTHVIRHDVHGGHFMFLFPLHATILEPNFYLAFSQTEGMSDFDASPAGQVTIEVEFFFEFQRLVAGV